MSFLLVIVLFSSCGFEREDELVGTYVIDEYELRSGKLTFQPRIIIKPNHSFECLTKDGKHVGDWDVWEVPDATTIHFKHNDSVKMEGQIAFGSDLVKDGKQQDYVIIGISPSRYYFPEFKGISFRKLK